MRTSTIIVCLALTLAAVSAPEVNAAPLNIYEHFSNLGKYLFGARMHPIEKHAAHRQATPGHSDERNIVAARQQDTTLSPAITANTDNLGTSSITAAGSTGSSLIREPEHAANPEDKDANSESKVSSSTTAASVQGSSVSSTEHKNPESPIDRHASATPKVAPVEVEEKEKTTTVAKKEAKNKFNIQLSDKAKRTLAVGAIAAVGISALAGTGVAVAQAVKSTNPAEKKENKGTLII